MDWELPARGGLAAFGLADCSKKSYSRRSAEISYEMSVRVLKLQREAFLRKELDIFARKTAARLFSTFSEAPKGPSLPFSVVDYVPGTDRLVVTAVHSYPEELTFIEVSSKWLTTLS